jgi:hypothetical protein
MVMGDFGSKGFYIYQAIFKKQAKSRQKQFENHKRTEKMGTGTYLFSLFRGTSRLWSADKAVSYLRHQMDRDVTDILTFWS